MIDNFYVTLPSNSSMNFFPDNTQSHFRTKLSKPITLNGFWEVGLSEICIPKNWFNIGHHNNHYSVTIQREEEIKRDINEYEIPLSDSITDDRKHIFEIINNHIKNIFPNSVNFIFDEETSQVEINITEKSEIHIDPNTASKLLYILHLPNEMTVINTSRVFRYRPTSSNFDEQFFILKDTSEMNFREHLIPIISVKEKDAVDDMFKQINLNISLILEDEIVTFNLRKDDKVWVSLKEGVELHLKKEYCPRLLALLSITSDEIIIKNNVELNFNFHHLVKNLKEEYFMLVMKNTKIVKRLIKKKEYLELETGIYQTSQELFNAFKYVKLRELQNRKVIMYVPDGVEITIENGLRDLLGYKKNKFSQGSSVSHYQIELNGGISEIFVYTDIIHSHHVGDTVAPVLRVIPVMTKDSEQIVKVYPSPLYFPVKKTFFDTIQVELRTSSGKEITFSAGKTNLVLSFRKKVV